MLRDITKLEFSIYKLSPESTCFFHCAVDACLQNENQLFLASSVTMGTYHEPVESSLQSCSL
jgi:hypothetical protein